MERAPKQANPAAGHIAALFTMAIWGTTFVSTKVLLVSFSPMEILFIRFVIGLAALFLIMPRLLGWMGWRRERIFMLAGLFGVTLYYLFENIALTFTLASNVGVIVSAAPFFIAIVERLVNHGKPLNASFLIGFAVAMTGICLISFSGQGIHLDLTGDLIALAAAVLWAGYSACMTRISTFAVPTIQATRRIFSYGILFMIPTLPFMGFAPTIEALSNPLNIANLLFLGLGASATCFVTWNFALKRLGAVVLSVYIYLTPAITAVASMLILSEELTAAAWLGVALTIAGLLFSQFAPGILRKRGESADGQL